MQAYLVEGVEVIGKVEEIEQGDDLIEVNIVVNVEDLSFVQGTLFPEIPPTLNDCGVGVVVSVSNDFVLLGNIGYFGICGWLVNVDEKLKDSLLFSCECSVR